MIFLSSSRNRNWRWHHNIKKFFNLDSSFDLFFTFTNNDENLSLESTLAILELGTPRAIIPLLYSFNECLTIVCRSTTGMYIFITKELKRNQSKLALDQIGLKKYSICSIYRLCVLRIFKILLLVNLIKVYFACSFDESLPFALGDRDNKKLKRSWFFELLHTREIATEDDIIISRSSLLHLISNHLTFFSLSQTMTKTYP